MTGSTQLIIMQDSVERLLNYLSFFNTAKSLRTELGGLLNWDSQSQALSLAREFLGYSVPEDQALINACYLGGVASFEEFLRESIKATVLKANAEEKHFNEFPIQSINANIMGAGKLLSRVNNLPAYAKIDVYDISKSLATIHPDSAAINFAPDAFIHRTQLLDLDEFVKDIKYFKSDFTLDLISSIGNVKSFLSLKKARETTNAIKNKMTSIVKNRNRIAHTSSSSDVTYETFEEDMNFLIALSIDIDTIFR